MVIILSLVGCTAQATEDQCIESVKTVALPVRFDHSVGHSLVEADY